LFELVVSELLVTELQRTLGYPKLRKRIPPERAAAFVEWVHDHATLAEDPDDPPPVGSRDPDDDYLLALAIHNRAYLVTGDQDPLVLSADFPILTSAQYVAKLGEIR
jgi:putative PIN family toxin of toxin-antitoxin system